MLTGERPTEHQSSIETHKLRVAVFDLSQRALAGYFNEPSLIEDYQPLNENGLPGITHETRAINLGVRQNLALPPMKVLGRLKHPTMNLDAYAVAASQPIEFRKFTLKRYDLDDVHEIVQETIAHLDRPRMDRINAHLLRSAFSIPEVRRVLS